MATPTLLVIDDEKEIAELVAQIAAEIGFDACLCTDYHKVKEIYDKLVPDVVVLDIMMPNMDGFEVLEFLTNRASYSNIVLMSGQATYRMMAEKIGTAKGLDVVANLSKPFRVNQVRAVLLELLNEIKQQDQPQQDIKIKKDGS